MNLNPSHYRQVARIRVYCCLIAAGMVAVPATSSAMSLIAAHEPDGPVHVALVRQQSGPAVAVSRSVGLMVGTDGTEDQASLGRAQVEVTRSVGLMEGAKV